MHRTPHAATSVAQALKVQLSSGRRAGISDVMRRQACTACAPGRASSGFSPRPMLIFFSASRRPPTEMAALCYFPRVRARRFASSDSRQGDAEPTDDLSPMEQAVNEQREILFPALRKMEEELEQDLARQAAAAPSEDWSPKQVPYRVHEKDGNVSDTDSEDEGAEEEVWPEAEVEEVGFTYRGPEPTQHGDWAHKGRVTDF